MKIIDGYPYSKTHGSIWNPCSWTCLKQYGEFEGMTLEEKMSLQESKNLVCQCGSIAFSIRHSADYETSAKCVSCGAEEVVHAG